LRALPLGRFGLRSRRIERCALTATKVDVTVAREVHGRGWRALKRMIEGGSLPTRVRQRALAVFRRLVEAEAEVHGHAADHVHLHEVGDDDAVIDVVAACLALERLGVDHIVVSPVTTGFGEIATSHGVYPVPAPATALLMRGVPVQGGNVQAERLTPTGAAILTTLADAWGSLPPMRPLAVGYGAGDRDLGEQSPNMLRMILGEQDSAAGRGAGEVAVLECSVDDATPQALAFAAERLLDAGALDVSTAAVTMKKGRAGHHITVLARPDRLHEIAQRLFQETSTLGLRYRLEQRMELPRQSRRVRTAFGPVAVKVGVVEQGSLRPWPEYEDCAALARRHGVALWRVQRAALEAFASSQERPRRKKKGERS
jgi:uncharacterized protein (TIGR00299 family) protein